MKSSWSGTGNAGRRAEKEFKMAAAHSWHAVVETSVSVQLFL